MKKLLWLFCLTPLLLSACSDMRSDVPLQRIDDYEMLLAGDLEAEFVGTDNCLAKCHSHDKVYKDFQMSVHGEQIDANTGLPLVNCESCHGAGSKAIEHAREGMSCNTMALMQIGSMPPQAQSLICLKCHPASSTPILNHWNASSHASAEISCFDCHDLHRGPQQKVDRHDMQELCTSCHQQIRSEFAQFSHHPVPEHKMTCTDCHNPHGSVNDFLLNGSTVKETCTRCHMEKQGPFIFEHADVSEVCTNCHSPHGSPNNDLVKLSQPFLCLQCHAGHNDDHHPGLVNEPNNAFDNFQQAFYNRCTDCHSAIHGTDIPSAKGNGSFIAR